VALTGTSGTGAQQSDGRRVSGHALLGVFVPTGRHRSAIGDAFAIGGQIGIGLRPSVALVGGALLSQTRYRGTVRGDLTLVQYDIGLELARARGSTGATPRGITPFVGAGAGARSYAVGEPDIGTRVYLAGYAAIGAELSAGRAGLRVEARDYVSRAEMSGTLSGMRNDVTAVAGLAYHFR
jgi:hypothetical protein